MGVSLETTYHDVLLPLKKCIMDEYNVRGTDKGLDKLGEGKILCGRRLFSWTSMVSRIR